jgi:dTDP-4-amino-4,6-dideoxygalactose transaminase
MNWKIPLTTPDLGEEEINAVVRVLESKWLTMGPVTRQFEQEFAAKMGVRHAIAVASCTAALHIANVVLDVRSGDEVICPALTFVATANAPRYTGAKVVFADVESLADWTISASDICRLITPRTKVITVMHYAGFACRMDEILHVASTHGLNIIEDCAHSPFGRYTHADGRKSYLGSLGTIGCFSFFSNKNMTTGEGGMITTNDDLLAEKIRLVRSHGMTALTLDRHRGHANDYDVVALGYNYRMDEIRSAIGRCQLAKIDSLTQHRRNVYRWYWEELSGRRNISVPFLDRDLDDAACHVFAILAGKQAVALRGRLAEAGIQTSRHYDLVPDFSAYHNGLPFRSTVPAREIVTLPLSPAMTREQVEQVCSFI